MKNQSLHIVAAGVDIDYPVALFYLEGQEFALQGNWNWPFECDVLFCSDVFISLAPSFIGTRSIFHPDDRDAVMATLMAAADNNSIPFLRFRIITSYGKVAVLEGSELTVCKSLFVSQLQGKSAAVFEDEKKAGKQALKNNWQLQASALAEKITGTGTLFFNTATHEMHYSDGVFRLFGLLPQSLNAHLNTFAPFIHPEDERIVADVFARAFRNQLPLHLQFRIKTAEGKEKTVQQVTSWEHNEEGILMLYGVLQDITEQERTEKQAAHTAEEASFQQRLLNFQEQSGNLGYWYMNLVTRKTVFSPQFFRLHGLKSSSVPGGIHFFLNFVHPDDLDMVKAGMQNIRDQNIPPEMDYRIVRPDGKTRYLRHRGKLMEYEGEMVMVCTLEDTTTERLLERKTIELKEQLSLQRAANQQAEEQASIAGWLWNLGTDAITWSKSFYRLLGYKSTGKELTLAQVQKLIYPEDRKIFLDRLHLMTRERCESNFVFRLNRLGQLLWIEASFKIVHYEEKAFFLCTLRDITGQQSLLHELKAKAHFTEMLTQNIPDLLLVTDENNTLVYLNKRAEDVFGVKREQILNKHFFDVFPFLQQDAILSDFHLALKGETVKRQAARWPRLPGCFDVQMVPMRNEDGAITGIFHLLQNVAAQRELEERLHERLYFIESLLEASVDRIVVMDRHMNYLYCNGKAAAYYGLPKEEIVGRNVLEIFPDSMNKPTFEHFRKALRGETVHVPAIEGLSEDHYFQTYLVPIKDDSDEITAVLWIHHDLSHEIKLQRQIKKADEILNNINEIFIELDSDGQLRYLNKRAKELISIKEKECLGRLVWDVFPHAKDSEGYPLIQKALTERIAVQGSYFSLVARRWLHLTAIPSADGVLLIFTDIDEIKKAQDKIMESESLLRKTTQATPDAMLVYDLETKQPLFLNDKLAQWVGLSSSELVAMGFEGWCSLIHPRDLPGLLTFHNSLKLALDEEILETSYRLQTSAGASIWVESRNKVFRRNEKGEAVQVLAVLKNITERKKVEAQLLEKTYFIQQITDATPDFIVVFDLTINKVIYINRHPYRGDEDRYRETTQLDYGGLIQRAHPDDRETLHQFIQGFRAAADDEVRSLEFRVQKGSTVIWYKSIAKVFKRDAAGTPTQIIEVLHHISGEIKLRQELTERSRYAETLIDASVDRMIVIDCNYRIQSWNRRCEEIYGMRRESVWNKNIFEVFPKKKEDPAITEGFRKAFSGERSHLPIRQEVYTNRFSELFFLPIYNDEGEVSLVLHILHDITNLYEAQEELKEINVVLEGKNRELAQRNEEATMFAFIASHDLKEPLRKVNVFTNWMLQKEEGHLSQQGKDFLQRMSNAVKRMNVLIEDLLSLTQMHDYGTRTAVDLNVILEEAKATLQTELERTGALIEAGPLPVITAVSAQMVHLFRNIISNAVNFARPGVVPQLTISAALEEEQGPAGTADYIKLYFTDNGQGFEQKYEKKMFQIFQRVHNHSASTGTGMGLTICRKIMENHGGFIYAQGRPGEGATFCCAFPVKP